MSLHDLQEMYRTGTSDLARDFFQPCLAACTKYRRAAGYFSSSALRTWAKCLPRLVRDDVAIQLLISPDLSPADVDAIQMAVNDHTRKEVLRAASERLIIEAIRFSDSPDNEQLQLKLFCWLVAAEHLEIRFALPKHIEDAGIFHDKCGIFDFPDGSAVAFSGSANETASGHSRNLERILVFRSWIQADVGRLVATTDDFDVMWSSQDPSLLVVPLTEHSLRYIKHNSPTQRPRPSASPPAEDPPSKWRHQDEAMAAFMSAEHGVLEMATGTGKTRTSLKILSRLVSEKRVSSAIVCTVGTDLLDQWYREVLEWKRANGLRWRVLRHYGGMHEAELFAIDPDNSLIVVSRQQLPRLLRQLGDQYRARCLIVHDEIHGLGSESNMYELLGQHGSFKYRLGLSATPERAYDDAGTQFIQDEIGPIIFKFGLEDAIARGILCELTYVPLEYELTIEDKRRLQAVQARKASAEANGQPMPDELFYTELARVYKTAENKPRVFKAFIEKHPEVLQRSIIFVDNTQYGYDVLKIVEPYTHLYRTYYAEDDPDDLRNFAKGDIECLITCHRVSQGIDIRSLTTVVLFSSSRAPLETVQRIGRCLRLDPSAPNKRALVVDFVLEDFAADKERKEWLQRLSAIKREE